MDQYIVVGGVTVTVTTAREALAILLVALGVMIKGPLQRAGSELAGMDYHAVAAGELEEFPEIARPAGTHRNPTAHAKIAVIHHLERRLAEYE